MKKCLLLAALCMLALPLLTSNSRSENYTFPNGIAMAGHTLTGAYCECGSTDCICDAVEVPLSPTRPKFYQTEVPGQPNPQAPIPESNSDLGVEILFGALLLALLLRLVS